MGIKAISWCWKQEVITSTQKFVLSCLANHYNDEDKKCYPSVKTIAKECRLGETAVKAALNELEDWNLIQKIERRSISGRHKSNIYILNLTVILTSDGVVKRPHGGSPSDHEPIIYKQPLPSVMGEDAIEEFLKDPPEPTPRDNSKDFWDEAVGMMMAMGVAEVTARPFIGRMLGWTRGNMAEALSVIDRALQEGTNNPISFIAAIYTKKKPKVSSRKEEMDALFKRLQTESDQIKAGWEEKLDEPQSETIDDGAGSGDDDHGVLQPKQRRKPRSVRKNDDKRPAKISTQRVAEVVAPAGGHLGEMQVSTLSGGGGEPLREFS